MQDVRSLCNNIPLERLEKTHIRGSKPIDSIALASRVLNYIEGMQLIPHNEFAVLDRKLYILDINIKKYFNDQFSS